MAAGRLLKNKVIQNYLYNVSYQIVMTASSVITVPYLTRVLGGNNLGIARYVESVVTMFTVFGMLGLGWYANRAVAYNRQDKYKLSQCFWEIFFMRIILMTATLLVYICGTHGSEYRIFFEVYIVHIVGYFLDISWFYIGIEEMKPVVIRNYIVRITTTVLLFVIVRDRGDLLIYIWLTCLTTLMNAVLVARWIGKYVTPLPFREIHVMRHFLPSLALFLPQAASQLYVQCDKVMIEALSPDISYVSYYTENERIAKLPVILAIALSTVLMPRVAYEFSKGRQDQVKLYIRNALYAMCFILFPCCCGMIAVANNLVPVFLGAEYADTYGILILLCPVMIFIGISNVTGIQYLVAVDKKKELTVTYLTALVVNFVINYLLIPGLSAYGAAIGTLVAEGLSGAMLYYYMKKDLGNVLEVRQVMKLFVLSLAMGVIVYLLNFLQLQLMLKLIIQIAVGVILYLAGVLVFRVFPGKGRPASQG